ncbi:MAG: FAD-dependent oxidoreductase [Clostridia bacterium]|nr:FAD-dependent oxidoreductase [Clostridia bacterium]
MGRIANFEEKNIINVAYECDVLVVGGGVAGIAASLAAARSGAKVILLEKGYMLGGLATAGLVTIYLPICDGMGRQVSFGLAEELLKLSIKHGVESRYPDEWLDRNDSIEVRAKGKRFQVQFNAQLFAIDAEKVLLDAGVKILYGTLAANVKMEEGKITYVVIENKSGRRAVEVRSVVDTTGDADICHLAGAKCTTHFNGNILAAWYYAFVEGKYILNMVGFSDVPEEQRKNDVKHKYLLERKFGGIDGEEISEFMQFSHEYTLKDFLSKYEGKNVAFPVTIATIPQLRMTRKLVGEYVLDEFEVHKHFESSIGMISDWRKRGPVFEIPFETLYGKEVKNLITAGRCISVTDNMWDITRAIPDCAVTGEAAGVAAAMSDDFTTLDIKKLQMELVRRGVKLHESDI